MNQLNCLRIITLNKSFLFLRDTYREYFNATRFSALSRRTFQYHHQSQLSKCVTSHSHVSPRHAHAHVTKGWKAVAKANAIIQDADTKLHKYEDGNEAISHDNLVMCLKECKTVSEQIKVLCNKLCLTPDDLRNRKDFCISLENCLKPYFPDIKVCQFGSSMNMLGFRGCDIDICIQTVTDQEVYEYASTWKVPEPDSVLNEQVSKEIVARLHPKLLLRFIRRVLRRDCLDIQEPIIFVRARCPILRFYNSKHNLFCDFSFENRPAVKNTRLLRFISHMDERVAQLLKVLRYWGKHGQFIGDSDMFNSYAFSLLVVYFLQNTSPPVLPPVEQLVSNSDYLKSGEIGDDVALHRDLKVVPKSENNQSVEELLKEFFFFYLYEDFSHIMRPLTGDSILKQEFKDNNDASVDKFEIGMISIQDPFRAIVNQTAGVSLRNSKRFLRGTFEACKLYQISKMNDSNGKPFDLLSLFDFSTHESLEESESVTNNGQQQFEIPLRLKDNTVDDPFSQLKLSAEYVKNILEQGLLAACKLSFVSSSGAKEKNMKQFFKLFCEVDRSIWLRRNHIEKQYCKKYSDRSVLEIEQLISKSLIDSSRDKIVLKFICECYGYFKNSVPTLNIKLSCETSKYAPIGLVFLQEYIEKTLRHLL